ncbi:hypothetical protein VMCG_03320 [Cytospora schulzeri]|uniref:Uncharacterized protein n=1 Tax=Cytospora schulzeri TaxID=448051 RepID=A0A423WXK2_9PEZI|nr:hypothetical protein VMCG_03320 [Valsa malicola]
MADYTGDGDVNVPFEHARQNADRLGINYGSLPHLPIWSRLFGLTSEDYHTKVAAKIMTSSASIGRELSPTEKDAMAYHFGKLFVTLSYGSPIAVFTAVGFLRRTNKTYGFPFYTPKQPKFNPNKFPGMPEGSTSRLVWNLTRGLAWYTASKVVISLFMTSYAVSVYAANLRGDPRLEPYRQDLSRRASKSARVDQQPGMASGSPEHRQQPFSSYSGKPTSASTPSPPSWAIPERSAQESTSAWPEPQSSQIEPPQGAISNDSSVFDDVSPVASSEQQEAPPQQPVQQGGSAWDRLRNQAQNSRNQTTAWAKKRDDEMTSRGAQQGTSYSYSSADEEKAYAKEQAQKEFDDMLEEERRGQTSGRR